MTARLLPHDTDAEVALAAAAIRNNDALDLALEHTTADHFYNASMGHVFRAAAELRSEGRPVDAVTVASRLADTGHLDRLELMSDHGDQVIDVLASYSTQGNIEGYAQIVLEKHALRTLIRTCEETICEAYECVDVPTLLNDAAQKLGNLAASGSTDSLSTLASPLSVELTKIRRAIETGIPLGVSMGLVDVDRVTGGLFDGELTIVAGRPATGKSSFVVNVLTHAAERGDGVFMASLEMPAGQVAMRIACGSIGVPYERFRQNRCTPSEFERLNEESKRVASLPFVIDDQPGITLTQLRTKMRKAERTLASAGRNLRVVAVDYIQLMRGNAETREQEISRITRGLKELCREFQLPIVALSQLNRGVEARSDKRPLLSDLRESGAIEQDADSVLMLYRDDYYNAASKQRGVTEVLVQKSRNGETGTINVAFDKGLTRFRDLTQAERLSAGLPSFSP